jgi:Holliday junction DNA helicase RuvA
VIARLTGRLERVEDASCTLLPGAGLPVGTPGATGADLAIEVLLPAYLAERLKPSTGQSVTFHTLLYLEGQGQGTSFIPRLLGFATPDEREFFELFTTVKGIGNRKALRALALPPAQVASAIAARNTRALVELPEIGKRLAETIIAELVGKVDRFALADLADPDRPGKGLAGAAALPPYPRSTLEAKPRPQPEQDAIDALCALGEQRSEAERKVELALTRADPARRASADSAERILALVYAAR